MERTESSCATTLSIFAIVLLHAVCQPCYSRQESTAPSPNQTKGTGSVAGRVTIGGKAAPGVTITLNREISDPNQIFDMVLGAAGNRTTTNSEGTYRFSELAAGEYTVDIVSPAYVVADYKSGNERDIVVKDGGALEGIDFELIRGGVITGRVTDSDGRPVMGGRVKVTRVDAGADEHPFYLEGYKPATDDRGIYRVFGLPPGRYKISAVRVRGIGPERNSPAAGATETFHPAATDKAQAAIVDVKSGFEVTGVDIRIGQPARTFTASGRVVDASTNRPVPGVPVVVSALGPDQDQRDPTMPPGSNARGEFKIDGLAPGRYRAAPYTAIAEENNHYGEPIEFEIKSQDLTGLEIRLKQGGSISGIVVSEGGGDSVRLPQMVLMTMPKIGDPSDQSTVDTVNPFAEASFSKAIVGADNTFRLSGLPPGRVTIMGLDMQSFRRLSITSIERDGVPQPNGIELAAAEQISGIRVVIGASNGAIQGQVRVDGGKLPDTAVLTASLSAKDGMAWDHRSVMVDSSLQFKFERLLPGKYTITLLAKDATPGTGSTVLAGPVSEEVVVQGDSPTVVTIAIDVSSIRPKQN